MPKTSSYRNKLVKFANDANRPGWARDLICLVLSKDGKLNCNDINKIAESLKKSSAVTLTPPSNAGIDLTPHINLVSIKHISGVNALEPNQEIVFCPKHFTLIYGLNASGKSSYFRVLNNLVSGGHPYKLQKNLYESAPKQSIELKYSIDNVESTFVWDTKSAVPDKLQYVRVFDSSYAKELIKPQTNGNYIFQSYSLNLYQGIYSAINEFKRKGLSLGPTESDLMSLCSQSYQQTLVDALKNQFDEEKKSLELSKLDVDMGIGDLMNEPQITLHINGTHDPSDILSDGELNGIAICLFLAECELQSVKNPIIFDDPVNSLDSRIMAHFVNRIQKLQNQTILFSHSQQLCDLVREETKKFKIYDNSETNFNPTSKPVYSYELTCDRIGHTGIVGKIDEFDSLKELNEADLILNNTSTFDLDGAVQHLRVAIENMVDEIIFNKQIPLKYRGRDRIQWKQYFKMITLQDQIIKEMQAAYNKLSNRRAHRGLGSVYAPLTRDDLSEISAAMRKIIEDRRP